ncbi:MAG: response regulator [Candidatus Thorarchaeota archaeon]
MTQKGRILIVDDNENLRKTMERVLKLKGYDVLSAANGVEALEIAQAQPEIDLVFMDIKMPLMNGVETHKKLKKIVPDTIVIMMTAYAVEELIQEALEDGAYGIVHKPLDFDRIIEIIEKAQTSENGALILVVDDDPGMRDSLRMILERRGFSVAVAKDGEEAVEAAQTRPFDILFIDMKLPTINGLETYLSIKEIRPEAVAVLITGIPADVGELVEEAMLSSAYSCLHKPLDMVQVFSIVDEVLTRKKGVT